MVLSRIASNFVQQKKSKNENTPPPKNRGLKAAHTQLRSSSTLPTASRRRRARLNGSVNKNARRVLDSARKRDIHRPRNESPCAAVRTPPHPIASSSQNTIVASSSSTQVVEDCEMGDAPLPPQEETPVFKGITLPRRLARPAYREVNVDALAAVDPELVGVSVEYIRDMLEETGLDLFRVLASTHILSTKSKDTLPNSFPKEARVRVADTRFDLPTHMLAVHSRVPTVTRPTPSPHTSGTQPSANNRTATRNVSLPSPGTDMGSENLERKTRVTLLPAHALVLAAHCTALPPLPKNSSSFSHQAQEDSANTASTSGNSESGAVISIPVVPLSLPSPSTFPLLSAYLYTQRVEDLIYSLLGVPLAGTRRKTASESQAPQTHSQSRIPFPSTSSQTTSSPAHDVDSSDSSDTDAESSLTAKLTSQLAQTSSILAAHYSYDARALLRKVDVVLGLWRNAYALGVFETGLWSALDTAWAVLLTALGACAGVSK